MFQQGLGEQAVTPSCALCTCWVWSPCATLPGSFSLSIRSKGRSLTIGKFGTRVGIRRAERDCSVL